MRGGGAAKAQTAPGARDLCYGDRFEVERDAEDADLVVEFPVCRQLGRSDVIGPLPDEWVDAVGAAVLTRWKTIGDDAPDQELMTLTACHIWRSREERAHCSKPAAAPWAPERNPFRRRRCRRRNPP
jgi:hypothetical protein